MILNTLILALMFSIKILRRDKSMLYAFSSSDNSRFLPFFTEIMLSSRVKITFIYCFLPWCNFVVPFSQDVISYDVQCVELLVGDFSFCGVNVMVFHGVNFPSCLARCMTNQIDDHIQTDKAVAPSSSSKCG